MNCILGYFVMFIAFFIIIHLLFLFFFITVFMNFNVLSLCVSEKRKLCWLEKSFGHSVTIILIVNVNNNNNNLISSLQFY